MLVTAIARELGAPRRPAIVAALVMVLCTEMFVYARSFFAESLATFMLTLAVYGYLRIDRRRAVAAIGIAGLVLAKPQLVFVALALIAAATIGLPRRSRIAGIAVGLGAVAFATALHMVHNVARFGDPTDFGGEDRTLDGSALAPGTAIESLGVLFVSPGRGLLIYSPLAALGLVTLVVHRRGHRVVAIAIAVVVAAIFVGMLNPGGGVNWGSRYLVPIIPLAAVGLAFLPPRQRGLAFALGAWGFLVNLPTALVPFESAYRLPVAAGEEPSAIYWSIAHGPIVRVWDQIPEVFDDRGAWITWWREVPGTATPVALLLSLAAVTAAAWIVRRSLGGPPGTRDTLAG